MSGVPFAILRHASTAWNEERRLQGLTDTTLSPAGDAEARRKGRSHQVRLRECRQIDEADPIRVCIPNVVSQLQRKPRLANTTGAD